MTVGDSQKRIQDRHQQRKVRTEACTMKYMGREDFNVGVGI